MFRAKIAGTGHYLPKNIRTNYDLEKMVETSHDWIVERTGISQRHIASPDEATSDMALIAAQNAIQSAGITAKDIDLIICATTTPDFIMPCTAAVLQDKLGARNVCSFDLAAACSGFVYSLGIANQFIKTGVYKHILVVGAETLSRIINWKDRETCILFGDGAGAFVISRANENDLGQIYSEHLYADGALNHLLEIPGGGTREPFSQKVLDQDLQFVRMKGREIFKNAVRTLADCCREALQTNKLSSEQVNWVIPHQANSRIIEALAKQMDLPLDKFIINVQKTGNTSSASIPIAFDEAVRSGQIKRGDVCVLAAFGAGLTSGSLLLKY